VAANLSMLLYFKYGTFLLMNFTALMSAFGVEYRPPAFDIVLPVGISFYTFATMSYTLDVYLRRAQPARNFLDYALFVTFFPQLIAGPIVHHAEILPQLGTSKTRNVGDDIGTAQAQRTSSLDGAIPITFGKLAIGAGLEAANRGDHNAHQANSGIATLTCTSGVLQHCPL